MGSPLGAWSRLLPERPQRRTPASDLVKSLIGIQERRDEKERLKRAEERMNRELAMREELNRKAEEWKMYEAQKDIDARTRAFEEVNREVLKNVLNPPPAPEAPAAEREKVTEKVGADGSKTVSVDRPLPGGNAVTPGDIFDADPGGETRIATRDGSVVVSPNMQLGTRLSPERRSPEYSGMDASIELGGGPDSTQIETNTPFISTPEIVQEIRRRAEAPETRMGPMGGYRPEYLEDKLARERAEALSGPAAIQQEILARYNAPFKETPEQRQEREIAVAKAREEARAANRQPQNRWKITGNPKTGVYRVDPETGDVEIVIEPSAGGLERPPAKVMAEMRDISFLAGKTLNLAALPSRYENEAASWSPNIIRNYMSSIHDREDDGFFKKYQKYDPAYFLFAAEMLKATQGGRPSDKDLEFYLAKMPRIDDLPDVKAEKIHWLMSQLKDKADATYDTYSPWFDMDRFQKIHVPSMEEILKLSGSRGEKVSGGTKIGETMTTEHGTFRWDGRGWEKVK